MRACRRARLRENPGARASFHRRRPCSPRRSFMRCAHAGPSGRRLDVLIYAGQREIPRGQQGRRRVIETGKHPSLGGTRAQLRRMGASLRPRRVGERERPCALVPARLRARLDTRSFRTQRDHHCLAQRVESLDLSRDPAADASRNAHAGTEPSTRQAWSHTGLRRRRATLSGRGAGAAARVARGVGTTALCRAAPRRPGIHLSAGVWTAGSRSRAGSTAQACRSSSPAATAHAERAYLDTAVARVCRPACIASRKAEIGRPEPAARACAAPLCVGPDTVTTHMSAAIGTPTVAIFGPTQPAHLGTVAARSRGAAAAIPPERHAAPAQRVSRPGSWRLRAVSAARLRAASASPRATSDPARSGHRHRRRGADALVCPPARVA